MFSHLNKKAQTLVETIISISIVTIALSGIIGLAISYLNVSGQGTDWSTAIYLGREAMEILRDIRDSHWQNPDSSWPLGLSDSDNPERECWLIEKDTTDLASATAADNCDISLCNNCQLYLTNDGIYTHIPGGSTQTNLKRLVRVTTGDDLGTNCPDAGDGCEKKVEVYVSWTEHDRSHQLKFEERLTDWR